MNPTNTIGSYRGTAITPGDDAFVRSQVDAINNSFLRPTKPIQSDGVITAGQLSTQPLAIAPVDSTTTAIGLSGVAQGVLESSNVEQEQQTKIAEGQAQKQQQQTGIKDTMTKILGIQAERTAQEETAGIPQMTKDVNTANQRFLQSQRAETNELRALETQIGLTPEGKQQSVSAIQRKYAFENADNALSLSLARQDLATAQTLIDKKIELQLEPLQTLLDYQKFFYDDNKEVLTKAEDRQFQLLLKESERKYETGKTELKMIGDLAIQAGENGAPGAVVTAISNAKTQQEAFEKAGQYLSDPLDRQLKQAQIGKINAEIAETKAGTDVSITRTDANGNPIAPTGADRALQIILGSGKFTKDQVRLVSSAINSGQDPFTVIKNQAKTILGGAGETTLTKYEIAESTLADIGEQINQFYSLGGRTGIFTGNFEKVVNKLGQVVDPRLVTLSTQIQGNIQVYRNAISGTAYSEQEGRDITSIFPGINKTSELNTAILKGREILFNSVIDSTYRTALGSAYDELKAEYGETGEATGTSDDFRTKYGY